MLNMYKIAARWPIDGELRSICTQTPMFHAASFGGDHRHPRNRRDDDVRCRSSIRVRCSTTSNATT